MPWISIGLLIIACVALILRFLVKRWKTFLWITAVFAILNSFVAAPKNWISLINGHEFWFRPITPTTPAIPIERLALPTDTPQVIIRKMGCYVCHKIPEIPESHFSSFGPLLIPKTIAPLRLTSPEYIAQVKENKANATTPEEYIQESILNPDAFIVPGYEDTKNPDISIMYHHYSRRFTQGALDVLTEHLLTLDVETAAKDGLVFSH